MTDVHETSMRLIRFLHTLGRSRPPRPETLSPAPWHLALFASSMVQEQDPDAQRPSGPGAATMTASPMPLDCCPPATRAHARGRGACQQSPTLHSSNSRLSATLTVSKGQTEHFYHAIGPKRQMPGVWGQSPQEPASMQRLDEPNMMRAGRLPCHSRAGGNPATLRAILDPRLRGGDIGKLILSDPLGTERST
jgi:hypothetical protein